jgi:hypothetical protein
MEQGTTWRRGQAQRFWSTPFGAHYRASLARDD